MPTYDYVCSSCRHEFERFQSITDAPVRTCPRCRKRTARRCIGSGAGIIFRGSGFYETDYRRSEDYKNESKSEREPAGAEKKDASPAPSGGDVAPASAAEKPAGEPSKGRKKRREGGGDA